jgi:3-dehydroquinate synthase
MTRIRIDPTPAQPASYDVIVEAGSLTRLGDIVQQTAPAHRYALITDRNVAAHWKDPALSSLAAAKLQVECFEIEPGETSKTRETWAALSDRMVMSGFGRDSAVIALGGGVIGDLAGFVAATYMRGVPVVQVPTTLLSMIDASVGGKTGVDVPAGKNLIGAFHQPSAVLADPETLVTLSDFELRGGMAEALKHGAIADAGYFDWLVDSSRALLQKETATLTDLVIGSVRIKAGYVALDPTESGPRAALNFGHTLGHAIERATAYTLHHGQAVALGMVGEATVGEIAGLTVADTSVRLSSVVGLFGLPTVLPAALPAQQIIELTRHDKKARQGAVRYALIGRIGELAPGHAGQWTWPIDDRVVMQALHSLGAPL